MSPFVVKLEQGSRGRGSNASRDEIFPLQNFQTCPVKWIPWLCLSGEKAAGAWSWSLNFTCPPINAKDKNVWKYAFRCLMCFHGLVRPDSQFYLADSEATKIAYYCNPCHTHEAYVNHHKPLSLVKVVMWLSLPEPVGMNRMAGGGSVTSGGRWDGVDSWGLMLWT
jgi:hypothetical protein